MAVTATPNTARLVLDYGEEGKTSLTRINPQASDENLHKMAQNLAVFQEGSVKDVLSYIETYLENE